MKTQNSPPGALGLGYGTFVRRPGGSLGYGSFGGTSKCEKDQGLQKCSRIMYFILKNDDFWPGVGGTPSGPIFREKSQKRAFWTLICENGRKKCLFVRKMHFAAKIWGDQGAKPQRG